MRRAVALLGCCLGCSASPSVSSPGDFIAAGDRLPGDRTGADRVGADFGDPIGADGGPRLDAMFDPCVPMMQTFADNRAPITTIYVDGGAGSGGDGSAGSPYGSLGVALNMATAGTEVRVSGTLPSSTYTVGLTGLSNAPIWITGEPGAHIGPLTLENASYVIIQDLEISNDPTGHVLHFFFSEYIMMRRLVIHDAGLGCIKGSQTRFAYVEDSDLYDAGNDSSHPILDFVGVNDGHIVDTKFHQGPGVMVMLKGGTSNMFFAWNEIYQQEAPGNALALGQSTGPQFFQPLNSAFEGERIIAFGNLLHDLTGAPFAFEGCKDCAAVHNTAWNVTGNQLVRFLPGAAGMTSGQTVSLSEGCRFAGNIVVGGQSGGASLNADAMNTGPGNVIDYNVFLKPGNLNWWGVIPQDMTSSTYGSDPALSMNGVPGNVGLVDGAGPHDIGGLPFAFRMVRDYTGACFAIPGDIGAIQVP